MGYHSQMDKGIFFIDLPTFKEYFRYTSVNYDSSGWSAARFLKLNDTQGPKSANGKEQLPKIHELTLTST